MVLHKAQYWQRSLDEQFVVAAKSAFQSRSGGLQNCPVGDFSHVACVNVLSLWMHTHSCDQRYCEEEELKMYETTEAWRLCHV